MRKLSFLLLGLFLFVSLTTDAQSSTVPQVALTLKYSTHGEDLGSENPLTASAPIEANYTLTVEQANGWTPYYEWTLRKEGSTTPLLTRYDKDFEYTFLSSGSFKVSYYVRFVNSQGEEVTYANTDDPIRVTISESKLEFPNAFSPNGDGINDTFKAKEGYQSIVQFEATIYNRWGQKLYHWTDPANGWDGTFDGKDVKQGVYYVLVKAKGADGRIFNIRRDINLLRGFTESANASTTP